MSRSCFPVLPKTDTKQTPNHSKRIRIQRFSSYRRFEFWTSELMFRNPREDISLHESEVRRCAHTVSTRAGVVVNRLHIESAAALPLPSPSCNSFVLDGWLPGSLQAATQEPNTDAKTCSGNTNRTFFIWLAGRTEAAHACPDTSNVSLSGATRNTCANPAARHFLCVLEFMVR